MLFKLHAAGGLCVNPMVVPVSRLLIWRKGCRFRIPNPPASELSMLYRHDLYAQ